MTPCTSEDLSVASGSDRRRTSTHFLALAACGLLALVSACENKAIGRVCEVQADGGVQQTLVNGQALECPTRICVRQAKDNNVARPVDTTSLCTAECSKDSDCEDAELRGSAGGDKRCQQGFVCGVGTVTGSFCCKKICLCKDFLQIPPGGLQTPQVCDFTKYPDSCPLIQK